MWVLGLFIICNKQNTEEDFREAFQKFGKIEEIYTIKDRNTGDSKGACVCVCACVVMNYLSFESS